MADVIAARLLIPVKTNAKTAVKDLNALDGSLKRTNSTLVVTGKAATRANKAVRETGKAFGALKSALPLAGIAGLILLFKKIVTETAQQQKATAQLNAVLKSTGQAAGLTSKELTTMASSLQQVTTFGDDAIVEAQALLLTFTKIGKDVFPQATETILNMAEAMNTDLKTATIQAGKALNDPILGVTALRRVGVQLTGQQEQLVKSFVKTGQIAKAQGVILQELETQFGGVARASAKTLGGALQQLGNNFGDALERVGTEFSPALIELANALSDVLREGGGLSEVLVFIGATARKTIEAITVLVRALDLLASAAKDIGDAFSEFSGDAEGAAALNEIAVALKNQKGASETAKAFEELSGSTSRLLGNSKQLAEENDKTAGSFNRYSSAAQGAAVSAKEAADQRKKAIDILAKAGDPSAFLEKQRTAFAQQKEIVAKAGLDVANLEKFQQQQRISQYDKFFKNIVTNQNASIAQRRTQLETTLSSILETENLSNEERLAAQQAFNQQSIALDQQRLQAIANNVQIGAQVLGGFADIARSFSQVRQNQIQKEIQALEERGASEEEIEAKRKQLQRKAAQDQKRFATYSVILDTATAIASALTVKPFPLGLVLASLAAAKGAAQLAVVQSQPIPKAQFGGRFEVPPGNEADSALVRVNQGEEINVTPADETQAGGGQKTIIVKIGEQEFRAYLIEETNRALNSGDITITRGGVVKAS